jgi:hypothetical protein
VDPLAVGLRVVRSLWLRISASGLRDFVPQAWFDFGLAAIDIATEEQMKTHPWQQPTRM